MTWKRVWGEIQVSKFYDSGCRRAAVIDSQNVTGWLDGVRTCKCLPGESV